MKMSECWPAMLAAMVFVIFCCGTTAHAVSSEHMGLLHVLETDQVAYTLSDTVFISYTVTNVSDTTAHILLALLHCPTFVQIYEPSGDLIWSNPAGCVDEAGWGTLLPGEAYSNQPMWDMTLGVSGVPIDEPGIYRITGHLTAYDEYGFGMELDIAIVDPTSDVLSEPGDLVGTWGLLKSLFR